MTRGIVPTIAALAVVLSACPQTEQAELKVHHMLSPRATAHAKFIVPWCKKIEKESAGDLKCQIYPAMQLGGSPTQLYDQVKDGVVDIMWTVPGYSAGRFPSIEVFELPFMMKDAEATSKALWDYVAQNDVREFDDVHLLAFHVHGPGYFHMIDKPVTGRADLQGLKIRAPTRQTNKLIGLLGATPVGMPVPQVPEALAKGVIDGCGQSECALLGGETAEMPGVYPPGEYDLAGFSVGIVEKSKIIDGSAVRVGDDVIGIASSGIHSNGYSLVRKIVEGRDLSEPFGRTTLGAELDRALA